MSDLYDQSKVRKEHLIAFVELCETVIAAVQEAGPQGAPAGPIYAACMTVGMSLEQFERLMAVIVRSGRLRKSGDLYFYVPLPETRQ